MRAGEGFTNPVPVPVASATTTSGASLPVNVVTYRHDLGGAGLPPDLVGAGSSIVASADLGGIVWSATGVGVVDRAPSPWRREGAVPLLLGSRVSVHLGEDGRTLRHLAHGWVTQDAGTHDAQMDVTVEGDLDDLSRPVSWPYLAALMPPAPDAPPIHRETMRRIGLTHWHVVDRCLRAAGRGTHPGPRAGIVVSAPLVDSTWPEVGTAVMSQRSSAAAEDYPRFTAGLGTRLLREGMARYVPASALTATSSVTVQLRVGPDHAGQADLTVTWPSGQMLVVRVAASRQVSVWGSGDSTTRVVRTLTATQDRFVVTATAAGAVTITTGDGVTSGSTTGTIVPVSDWATASASWVTLSAADGSALGGLQVLAGTSTDYLSWTQPAYLQTAPSTIPTALTDLPRQQGTDALSMLTEVTRAACLVLRRDSDRIIHVSAPDAIRAAPSALTITAPMIEAFRWSRTLDVIRHQVILERSVPEVTASGHVPKVTLWQSGGETLARGHLRRDVIGVPDGEDWIVSTELHKIGDPISSSVWSNPNVGQGSIVGGWVSVGGADVRDRWADDEIAVTLNTANPAAGLYVITSATQTAAMAAGEAVVLATPPVEDSTSLPTRYRDAHLPILRGWRRCLWVDGQTASTIVGHEEAPDLTHDVGPYVQAGAQALADWIAGIACPTDGRTGLVHVAVTIRPDWRIEAGDVITVHDRDVTALTLKCLVLSVVASVESGDLSMTLTLEVLEGSSTLHTYAQVDAHHAGRTYTQVDTITGTATYAAVDAYPKRD